MKNILIVCGNGLGSSFMVALKVEKLIKEMGIDASVKHSDLSSAKGMNADLYLGASDITKNLEGQGRVVVGLKNMLDEKELRKALTENLL